ncbi:hypothetical protein Desti_4678 [Desulfomonile tiedjei DSM 6799]|uniref:Uncharacterized protein n=1 Tax=Desulfomonile tiedjei (strain ATCC 49306 / DSM 6799 / DCB-1) TaxID=706587 RepID=I4CCK8_DESTA|nr:hypothetical protein Desti_4678 [Desulfomonile tiedjei DSM 6799]
MKANSEKDASPVDTESRLRAEIDRFVLCRTSTCDCRIDRGKCEEGTEVRSFQSEKEAHEALVHRWEKGTCF